MWSIAVAFTCVEIVGNRAFVPHSLCVIASFSFFFQFNERDAKSIRPVSPIFRVVVHPTDPYKKPNKNMPTPGFRIDLGMWFAVCVRSHEVYPGSTCLFCQPLRITISIFVLLVRFMDDFRNIMLYTRNTYHCGSKLLSSCNHKNPENSDMGYMCKPRVTFGTIKRNYLKRLRNCHD